MYLLLASASPRRAEILRRIGVSFTVLPADADESVSASLSPAETVAALSLRKARAVFSKCEAENLLFDGKAAGKEIPILAADTMVERGGRLLGKPHDEEEALQMLHTLSGKSHTVHTGVTVLYRGKEVSRTVATEVFFRTLSDEEIRAYVKSGEPLDKAGAYGIQGKGALLVEKIVGDYDNVVGLPAAALYTLFRDEFSVSLADFIG